MTTKIGYAPLGKDKKIAIPSQNLHIDPKGESSFRGKGVYIGKGYPVDVKGTGKARKQKATWF